MRTYSWICVLVLAVIAIPVWAQAPEDNLPELKTKVKTLAAFKNGLAFVFRAGETGLKNGWAAMDEIPAAALGTLWIGTTSRDGRVDEVISFRSKLAREYDPVNLGELLEANVGKKVFVTYSAGGTDGPTRVEGEVLSVPKDRIPDDVGPLPGSRREVDYPRAQIVLLRTEHGGAQAVLALNKQSIQSVEMAEDSAFKTKIEREVSRAKLRIGGKPKSAEITLAYLEKGINWSPSYLVNIHDAQKADITLEAVLANDVEDLEDVDVSFVAGYPNFMFADMITPLALQQTVSSFVQGLMSARGPGRPGGYGGVMAQSMAQSVEYSLADQYGRAEWRPESAYSATRPMPGETNEDLYFYRQEHVTLKKDSRARYTVFTDKVPYAHIYEWDVPDTMNIDDRGYKLESRRTEEESYQVWHALQLQNTTKQPWTTAPAFTVNGSMPVAQDVLKYAPPGGKNTLKLTVATDVRAEQEQIEASRTHVQILGSRFDEVVVDGSLTLKNRKQKAIRANVKKSLIGEVINAGEGGQVKKVVKKLAAVNPTSEIEWEFNLDSGEEKVLTYRYKAYVNF